MRIVVNDIAASHGGAMAILTSFYEYVRDNDKTNTWIFLVSNDNFPETERIKIVNREDVKKNWLRKLKFDFLDGARYIDSFTPDYVLSLQNILTFGVKAAQGVYVHQAIPFQDSKKFSFFKREERTYAFYQCFVGFLIKCSVRAADTVFVQTKWMKRNVARKSGVSEEKISVISVENRIAAIPQAREVLNNEAKTDSERFRLTGKDGKRGNTVCISRFSYCTGGEKDPLFSQQRIIQNSPDEKQSAASRFFYPGAFESCYKNQKCIYDACELLRTEGRKNFEIVLTLKESSYQAEEIVCCGRLNKEEMISYYQNSTLVFPSYLETVGLPLVEAMSAGAVILAADCEYAHEVLDSYENAYFFNPFKHEELKRLMVDVMDGRINKKNTNGHLREMEGGWCVLLDRIQEEM